MARTDLNEALPDEVRVRDDGSPLPALYVGPLYRGNGGEDAREALEARLRDLERQPGDWPATAA